MLDILLRKRKKASTVSVREQLGLAAQQVSLVQPIRKSIAMWSKNVFVLQLICGDNLQNSLKNATVALAANPLPLPAAAAAPHKGNMTVWNKDLPPWMWIFWDMHMFQSGGYIPLMVVRYSRGASHLRWEERWIYNDFMNMYPHEWKPFQIFFFLK